MSNKVNRIFFSLFGFILGIMLGVAILEISQEYEWIKANIVLEMVLIIGPAIILAIILNILSPTLSKALSKLTKTIRRGLKRASISDLIFSVGGGLLGAIFAFLISMPISSSISNTGLSSFLTLTIYVIFIYIGITVPMLMREEINSFISEKRGNQAANNKKKILDTSIIIDGRIFDLCKTGFIEGPIIIPKFVLFELQQVADSADDLKRLKGRRGLDILKKIQKELDIEITINNDEYEEFEGVDTKLLQLAEDIGGCIMTTDYNLNKVAEIQGIVVLNINELANAIKPVLLPGEKITVMIIKAGKEMGQGIAYLDDGTMIVVENGKSAVGSSCNVMITSVLQTAAGRMLFSKLLEVNK